MEINSKTRKRTVVISSGTTVAEQRLEPETTYEDLRLELVLGMGMGLGRDCIDCPWYYFRFVHRLFLFIRMPILNSRVLFWFFICCFRILVVFRIFRASAIETGSAGTQQLKDHTEGRATSSQSAPSFASVAPEVFMSFVTNRQGSQISANYCKAGG